MCVPHGAYLTAVQICIQPTTGRSSLAVERLALAERERMVLADVESQIRGDERPLRGEPLTPTVVLRSAHLTPTQLDILINLHKHTTTHWFPCVPAGRQTDLDTCIQVVCI